MGDLKYTNLVIPNLDTLIDELLETARVAQGLTFEQMEKVLADGKIFEMIEDTLPDFIINQHDHKYLDNWLDIFGRNQKKIIEEYPAMFLNYNLFVHSAHNLFDRLKELMNKKTIGIADLVRMTLLGTLCRMADEVGVLLSHGSTRTALAVYRSVYEHAVVGVFLMKQSNAVLYKKFADYGHKDARKKADSLDNHFEALKFPPLEAERRRDIDNRTAELKQLYGKGFFDDYGWAKDHLSERPSFWAIEKAAGLEKYRPFYIWASQFTHPSFQTLANIKNEKGQMILDKLTQQTTERSSFIDPMQLTTTALYIFIDFLLYEYSVEQQYPANILMFRKMLERLMKSFDDANNEKGK
ncbi:DUF5677 domain-containing protein [Mucilaginibacter sp. L196]|uniref:DUF5677 domain-containing protein n=1 Tax=Mucilaginibacter sp. L196 TaxID=1641870 RepID=UPI00131B7BF9|nr:DUF5677 domain-containing protein [Mucilaginibacter sp. L196]